MSRIRIIVLTKSYKDGDYCVAGINCSNSQWVRLVSENENFCGAIDNKSLSYGNGGFASPLDVIEVYIKDSPKNYRFQKENILMNKDYPIKKIGEAILKEVLRLHPAEKTEIIFGNTYGAINSKSKNLSKIHSSLIFIKVKNLKVEENRFDKWKLNFVYNEVHYHDFSLTDPDYLHQDNTIDSAYLVISFPEFPFVDGKYYKFIAKVFQE